MYNVWALGYSLRALSEAILTPRKGEDLEPYRIDVGRELDAMGASTAEIFEADVCEVMREEPARWSEGIEVCDRGQLWSALQWVTSAISRSRDAA